MSHLGRIVDEVPTRVASAWQRAHDQLQESMEFFHRRKAAGKIVFELSMEGGTPMLGEIEHTAREQVGSREAVLQATRRRKG